MINKRVEDLSKVFDRTWKANHNDVAKRAKEQEKHFMDKMFNTKKINNSGNITPGDRVNNLNNNMNSVFHGQRQNNLNNIVKKWK